MTDRPLHFYVHIQKTAGTALLRRLRHAVGPDAVYPAPSEQGTPEVVLGVDHLLRRLGKGGSHLQIITGHFPLCTVDLLDRPASTFTVLREPIERTLSFLRHQREVEPRFAGWELEAIYEDPIATGPLVANHMVKMLGMDRNEMTDGAVTPVMVTETHLERALSNLTDRIDLFGFQEDFERFCADLEVAFGWDLGPAVFMNRTSPTSASEELRRRIEADNQLDVALHRAALELRPERRTPSASQGTVDP